MKKMNKVTFKSYDYNFKKEAKGVKNNTIRELDLNDERYKKICDWWLDEDYADKEIEIINKDFENESFTRKIKDISFWKNWVIITWVDEKNE